MTAGSLAAWAVGNWHLLAAGIPALASLVHHIRKDGLTAMMSFWQPVLLTYVGTLYALNIGWLAVTDRQLLAPSLQTRAFLGVVSGAVLAYFASRGLDGTRIGDWFRATLEEALIGSSSAKHPLEEPCQILHELVHGLRDGTVEMELQASERFHEADGMVRACLPHLRLPESQVEDVRSQSDRCRQLLEDGGHLLDDSRLSRDALSRYHGTLKTLLHLSMPPSSGPARDDASNPT